MMVAHNDAGASVRINERLDMKKLIATLFFGVMTFGSRYGCVIDDGYAGDGSSEVEMVQQGGRARDRRGDARLCHQPGERDARRRRRRFLRNAVQGAEYTVPFIVEVLLHHLAARAFREIRFRTIFSG